jgi:hypothetical protein
MAHRGLASRLQFAQGHTHRGPTETTTVNPQANDMDVARAILGYFLRCPDAKDTLEGVAGWWLERERVHHSVDEVAIALRFLVARGLVIEKPGAGGRRLYQVDSQKRFQILSFLEGVASA